MDRVAALEQTLRRIGRASGTDLARLLDISPATLSRTVQAAGARVCRMGRRRGAMYALRRRVPGLPDRIPVMRVDARGAVDRLGDIEAATDGRAPAGSSHGGTARRLRSDPGHGGE